MSSPSGVSDPSAVLQGVLRRVVEDANDKLLTAVKANLEESQANVIAQYQELAVLNGTLSAQLSDLSKSISGEKRKPKLADAAAAPAEAVEVAPADAEAAAAPAVAEVKKAPRLNKMTWARTKMQADPEFKKWILAEVSKVDKAFVVGLPANPGLAKKTGAAKVSAEATLIWKLISDKKAPAYAPLMKSVEEKFAADKTALIADAAAAGENHVADQHTDDE